MKIYIILISVLTASCCVLKRAPEPKYISDVSETNDTSKVSVMVHIKGGALRDTLYLTSQPDTISIKDTIFKIDTIVTKNDSLGIELRRWKTRANQLIIECIKHDETRRAEVDKITKTQREIRYVPEYRDKIVEVIKWGFWEWTMLVAMCVFFVISCAFLLVIFVRK